MDRNDVFDVIVVGGGPAGLSAALVLVRARRRVAVFDAGTPRNSAAEHSHGYFTRDGIAPAEMLMIGREQLLAYPEARFFPQAITDARVTNSWVEARTAQQDFFFSRKLIIATGVTDELPPIENIKQFWGKSVFHCPFCHAYEFHDQPLAVFANGAPALELVMLLRGWSKDILLCTHGPHQFKDHEMKLLARNHVAIKEQHVVRLEGKDGQLEKMVFADGLSLPRKGLLLTPTQKQQSSLAQKMGLLRNGVLTLNQQGQSIQPEVFFAGDTVTIFSPQFAISAAYSGAFTAKWVHHYLAEEDFHQGPK